MDDPRDIARKALEAVRQEIRWKPGKDVQHLKRRIARGHLSNNATLADYEAIISAVVNSHVAEILIYEWKGTPYPTVVALVEGTPWLVMTSAAGIMETAFLIDEDGYLDEERFTRLGRAEEILA